MNKVNLLKKNLVLFDFISCLGYAGSHEYKNKLTVDINLFCGALEKTMLVVDDPRCYHALANPSASHKFVPTVW